MAASVQSNLIMDGVRIAEVGANCPASCKVRQHMMHRSGTATAAAGGSNFLLEVISNCDFQTGSVSLHQGRLPAKWHKA